MKYKLEVFDGEEIRTKRCRTFTEVKVIWKKQNKKLLKVDKKKLIKGYTTIIGWGLSDAEARRLCN